MQKNLLLLPVAAMWGCTDYVSQWDDKYESAFGVGSPVPERVCTEGATKSLADGDCVTNFLCENNAWNPQGFVCNNNQQQKICNDGAIRNVAEGTCSMKYICSNNAWVVLEQMVCTSPVIISSSSWVLPTISSSSIAKTSSSVVKSSSSVKRSSSSMVKSSSSVVKSSSSKARRAVGIATWPWRGDEGSTRVKTGLDNGSETSGYWFAFYDNDDGGASKIVWNGVVNEFGAFDDVILTCGGVCGTAVLGKGVLTYNPFVGIGFNLAGVDDAGFAEPGDASAWDGVCITYKSDAASTLEMGLGEVDAEIGYANPFANLPKTVGSGSKKQFVWSDFRQPSWYKGALKISGPEAATQLVSLKFKIQAIPGNYKFNVCAIGPYNGGCPATCE